MRVAVAVNRLSDRLWIVERTIAVFARWPEPGRVKTRLSPALPANLACDLHRAMLADTLSAVRSVDADRRILLWGDPPAGGAASPETEAIPWGAQRGAELGERLEIAFDDLFSAGSSTVIVGSDAVASLIERRVQRWTE